MKLNAYGKINISLDIVGKRDDGYHLLKMIMQNVDIYDELEFEKIDNGIEILSENKIIPLNKNNLIYKAAELFINTFDVKGGIKVKIAKNIPIAAGMAGGSADAAATLKAMRDLYKKEIDDKTLMELGVKIGADVPYCILGGTALCEGIGEIITPLKSFKNHILVIVKPNFGISTKAVYKAIDIKKIYNHPKTEELISGMEKDDLNFVSKNMKNLLENVTVRKNPIINEIKGEMIENGALGSMMTGSGPTVFGFFEDMQKAQKCYDKLKTKYKECYITRTI